MPSKEYTADSGTAIAEAPERDRLDIEGAQRRLAESREFYDHQAMHGRAPGNIVQIPLRDIRESPTNPRRTYSASGMADLVASVKAVGVMQAVLVRPVRLPIDPLTIDCYELVYGHRRLRAAQGAELATLPCTVREMGDAECAQLQAVENLQREDLTSIDEAQGYAAYIQAHGITKDELAELIGKSRTHVYNRLKLAELVPDAAQALIDGKIKTEVATLIARVPVALQPKALKMTEEAAWGGEPASYRKVRDILLEKFTLGLKEAIFDKADAALLPLAGACTTCPKRSGQTPELYADISETRRTAHTTYAGNPDVCTDPDCFDEKKKAHLGNERLKLEAKGATVVGGNAARSAISAYGEVKGAYVALKDVKAELAKLKKDGKAIADVAIVTIQNPRNGKTVQAVKMADVKAAGVKVKESPKANDYRAQQAKCEEQDHKNKIQADAQTKANLLLLRDVHDAAEKVDRTEFDLRLVASVAWAGVQYPDKERLAHFYGFKDEHALGKFIEQMDSVALGLFCLSGALIKNVYVHPYALDLKPERLLAAAQHYGVKVGLGTVTEPAAKPAKEKRAKAPKGAAAAAAVQDDEDMFSEETQ